MKAWRLQGEVVLASEKDPEGWGATEKFTVVLQTAGLDATELSAYCREQGLCPEEVDRWRQASQGASEKPVLTLTKQKDLDRRHQQYLREIKKLKQASDNRNCEPANVYARGRGQMQINNWPQKLNQICVDVMVILFRSIGSSCKVTR